MPSEKRERHHPVNQWSTLYIKRVDRVSRGKHDAFARWTLCIPSDANDINDTLGVFVCEREAEFQFHLARPWPVNVNGSLIGQILLQFSPISVSFCTSIVPDDYTFEM